AGPSPDRLLAGSEGILGVISEAWMRVRPRPEFRASAPVEFDDFLAGAAAVRAISQSGLDPANCRLLDPGEAELTGAGDGSAALLILGFESAQIAVDWELEQALQLAREHGGRPGKARVTGGERTPAGAAVGKEVADAVESWRGAFLLAPYLRDTFV